MNNFGSGSTNNTDLLFLLLVVEEKLGWVQKKASEDTRKQEQNISKAADYVTEKVAEVKEEIKKSTSEWTADAKHKVDEAVHPTHLKDYGKLNIIFYIDFEHSISI